MHQAINGASRTLKDKWLRSAGAPIHQLLSLHRSRARFPFSPHAQHHRRSHHHRLLLQPQRQPIRHHSTTITSLLLAPPPLGCKLWPLLSLNLVATATTMGHKSWLSPLPWAVADWLGSRTIGRRQSTGKQNHSCVAILVLLDEKDAASPPAGSSHYHHAVGKVPHTTVALVAEHLFDRGSLLMALQMASKKRFLTKSWWRGSRSKGCGGRWFGGQVKVKVRGENGVAEVHGGGWWQAGGAGGAFGN